MKINKIKIDGMRARTWLSVMDVCKACPYMSNSCLNDECDVIEMIIEDSQNGDDEIINRIEIG